ncbi:polyferredoxin [Oleiphilus messinensis]|uniref:Polyferredoxin n=1 Tax=Oleiphilus messinensis TaxID=141451 RepID=A0A1Y0IAA0_9GAMM|nr:cytochrome c oxidase accessory protein CcoG [Oleiphilus messinensis]ARU56323.1 polyferredoxin [Oleiphilus messinensis]
MSNNASNSENVSSVTKIPTQDITDSNQAGLSADTPPKPQTIELYASRKKIYVKEIQGFFQRIRSISLWLLMGSYFLLCWINVNGQPLIHFDLPERKFHLFGTTFWPQDFILLSWLLIICAFGLFFITTLFGRMWCGYTCPQTAWTFVFMWIEERIEGSRNQRIKLDKAPNSTNKLLKKSLKHGAWLFVALATGLTFVGYFYPIRELVPDLFTFTVSSGWAYFWIAFFTLATYINAGWMREQVCLYMCPYARFQSVMFDQDTLTVSYDYQRGEPRGKRKKSADPVSSGLGHCVDCGMCVQVCPTGIDIRDGLQYECIGCALCVDACDQIMDKMNYPRGLISYATEKALEGSESHLVRPKSIGYLTALVLMVLAVVYSIATRIPLELDVIRDRGALYYTTPKGFIENTYTLKIVNMADTLREFDVTVEGLPGGFISTTTRVTIQSGEVASVPISVETDPANLKSTSHEITFYATAVDNPDTVADSDSRFLGPPPLL